MQYDSKNKIWRNLNAIDIQKFQANRYPWFFLDEITELCAGKYAIGSKSFSYNEWFFPPHFADHPCVPGAILTEICAQTFLMSFLPLCVSLNENGIPQSPAPTAISSSSSSSKYKLEVVPGNKLQIKAELKFYSRGVAKGNAIGKIGENVAICCDYCVAVPSVLQEFKKGAK